MQGLEITEKMMSRISLISLKSVVFFCMHDSLLHFKVGISTSGTIISTLSDIKKCVCITSA